MNNNIKKIKLFFLIGAVLMIVSCTKNDDGFEDYFQEEKISLEKKELKDRVGTGSGDRNNDGN